MRAPPSGELQASGTASTRTWAVYEGTQHEAQSLGAPDPNSQGGRECHDGQRNKARVILEGMCRQHGARKQQIQQPGGVGWKCSTHHQGPEKLRHGRHLQWRRDPSHGQLTCFWALPSEPILAKALGPEVGLDNW